MFPKNKNLKKCQGQHRLLLSLLLLRFSGLIKNRCVGDNPTNTGTVLEWGGGLAGVGMGCEELGEPEEGLCCPASGA